MKKEYQDFIKAHPQLIEKYDHKFTINGEQARKILAEKGTEEQKKFLDKIVDGKTYTLTETRFRPINTKRRIRTMIEQKYPDARIKRWMKEALMSQKQFKKPARADNNDNGADGIPVS